VEIELAWVATIDALSSAIVGFPSPASLSTTNATSVFVVAAKDFPCNGEGVKKW
jgi:hypothetical protein